MSKYRFSGKTCIYCLNEPSTPTGDHVFARAFFLVSLRDNLPKVPCCLACNRTKSALERYLSAILPLGARHNDAIPNAESAEARILKNAKLLRELVAGTKKELVEISPGVSDEKFVLPFSTAAFHELFIFIVKALAWHHWKIEIPSQFGVRVGSLTHAGEQLLAPLLMEKNITKLVNENLGNGTFTYKGAQAADYAEMTIWQFSVYGGFLIADEISQSSCVWAITGRESFFAHPALKTFFERLDCKT
jgi:hypothetical protein